jgi:hypothetical protein
MEKVAVWIVALAMAFGSFFLGLWIYVKVWALIAIPMGAHPITMTQAYGVATLAGFFLAPALSRYVEDKEGEGYERVMKLSAYATMSHLISWLMAYWIFG